MSKSKNTNHFSPSVFHRHLMDETRQELSFENAFEGDLKKWQGRLRRKLRQLIGEMPEARGDLNERSEWTQEHRLGTIEKIVFTSEPYADVPAYVCLPAGGKPPYKFMICVQGHSTGMHNSIGVERDDEMKAFAVEGDRDFALGCMERGIGALCVEQRSFGLRREQVQEQVAKHGCHDATMHALMLGRTLLGERVFDIDRGIDYLERRGDVDMKRVGVMGNSGGGTSSLFAAALLPRVQFGMPSCYFCTFRDSIMSIYHCMDNYVPGLLRYAEMSDCMGLFAPRPVVIVAGKEDPIFPIQAVRKAFRNLQKIYEAAGAPGNCKLVVGNEGHRFYAKEAWPKMLAFLKKS
ncbi:prolyl oligopeptidase family serine peptidase [bacterium]|nr:prolyl oligopeptidase family serine peptidase [bacterium]